MTRRELIQKTTLALGYSLSAPTMMGLLSGCQLNHTISFKPIFFTEKQAVIMADLADQILPRTKTPGAIDVGVPAFIDGFVKAVYPKAEQDKFVKDLEDFNREPVGRYFRTFVECFPDVQRLYAQEVHLDAIKLARNVSEGWWNSDKVERPFILKAKELTLLGYFSSEIGATQVLQYNQAPGPYQGCVPLSKVGKAWATQ